LYSFASAVGLEIALMLSILGLPPAVLTCGTLLRLASPTTTPARLVRRVDRVGTCGTRDPSHVPELEMTACAIMNAAAVGIHLPSGPGW